jgi:outer membrane immunogenic protein
MKKLITTALMASACTTVFAADLPSRAYLKAAPYPEPSAYNWSGFYLGANIGGAVAGTRVTTDPSILIGTGPQDSNDLYGAGLTGGVQVGYNWQFSPHWLWGVEADIGALNAKRTTCDINDCTSTPLVFSSHTNYLGTVRGRLGYSWDRSMLYVTGGGAFAAVRDSFNEYGTLGAHHDQTRGGYAVGMGLETALFSNWSVKAEYLFADVGTNRVLSVANPGAYLDFKHEYHIGRIGLNYRFGGAGY